MAKTTSYTRIFSGYQGQGTADSAVLDPMLTRQGSLEQG